MHPLHPNRKIGCGLSTRLAGTGRRSDSLFDVDREVRRWSMVLRPVELGTPNLRLVRPTNAGLITLLR